MALSQTFTFEIEGASFHARVTRVKGRERIHAPFSFEVTCAPAADDGTAPEVDLRSLLAKKAKLSWPLPDGGERSIEGYVDAAAAEHTGFRFTVVPKIALLGDAVDHQIFVDKDAVAIVKEVLSEHGISVDLRVVRTPTKRPQCVQVFESDLAFISRLCAEEGITWYVPSGKIDAITLTDHASGYDDLEGNPTFTVRERGGLVAGESVFEARVKSTVVPDKVTLRDYDFEKPLLDQTASADAGTSARERYEYPGGYTDPALGKTLAQIRLDQLRARRIVLHGSTTSPRLAPGYVITLAHGSRDQISGRWIILDVEHEAVDQGAGAAGQHRYLARFSAVPADAGYREERQSAPVLGGIQTATVTGASGAELNTEQHGRTKIQLRWDRRRPRDDTASTFVRVVQPPTSGGFFLPRVGWEALVSFEGGSADVPYIVGRLYNGQAPPPGGLPGKKIVSAFGTMTTPGGGSANLIETNDTAGSEGMHLNASKDFNERTENDKTSSITANDSWTVGAARKLIVGQVLSVKVGAAQSYSVGGSRTVNVTSNKMIAAGSETVMIGGLRSFNVGGDYKTACSTMTRLVGGAKAEVAIESVVRSVKGAQTVLVGGSWKTLAGASANVGVSGAATEVVAGAKSIKASKYYLAVKGAYNETLASRSVKAGGDRQEGFGAAGSYSIGASASLKGSEITVTATSKITLKAGGVTITITPGEITIDGEYKSSVDSDDQGDQDYGD
ncbi:MAG: type VI secretion system tip protein TssI/VgrG [Byssovorax sp.]